MITEKLMGKYQNYIYRDIESGFTIFRVRPQLSANIADKMKGGFVICKGVLATVNTEIPMEFSGTWESNDHGWTFCVMDYAEKSWDDMITLDFLKSIKGISDIVAKKIIAEFGDFFNDIKLPGASVRLSMVSGVTAEKSQQIITQIKNQSEKREIMKFLFVHGAKMLHVDRLYSNYGLDGINKIKDDPYEVGLQIGLPLKSCDSIAASQQKDMKDQKRIKAYIENYLQTQMMSGNIYIKEPQLLPDVLKVLNFDTFSGSDRFRVLMALKNSDEVVYAKDDDGSKIYLKYLKKAEDNLAEQIIRLQSAGLKTKYNEEYADYAESVAGFKFAPEQRGAFRLLRKTGIGILTGGPGTGKTTTVKGIIDAYEKMYPDNKVRLCAPTGRAAQRMTESTGRPATTIHRLLEYKPFEGKESDIRCKNEYDPIDADFIIVDEVSMLDCPLASLFFSAVKSGALVIMVGDIHQLQSVGAGDVLNDMIKSKTIPVEKLIKTYRQAADSNIIKNANEINNGHDCLRQDSDFEIYQTQNITDKIVDIIKEYHKLDDLFYAQILSPSHKNDGGVADINNRLQKELNPGIVPELIYGRNRKFKLHDKIIMIKNNPEKGYYNGDVGYITEIVEEEMTVKIQDTEIRLSKSNLDDVKLAYAMTIHKSQGSEFPITIIALPNSGMLKRNLLYTAVTRAKKKVIIVQQQGSISMAVKRNEVGKRNTTLVERLHDIVIERCIELQ